MKNNPGGSEGETLTAVISSVPASEQARFIRHSEGNVMLDTVVARESMEFVTQFAEPQVRLHLLVVDADAAVRSACAEIAAGLGYAVESTGDLTQARSLLSGQVADIVLVNLPAGSNHCLELVSEVKALHPDISVIVMTATSSVSKAVEAMRRGACDYLTKPFAMDEPLRGARPRGAGPQDRHRDPRVAREAAPV